MAYKRYIKRNGKVFGPYVYHNIKIDGAVVTVYLGSSVEGVLEMCCSLIAQGYFLKKFDKDVDKFLEEFG